MKKSKIVGLSLGFTALAAVAISTPFIVTSCSKSASNEISGKVLSSAISTITTDGTTVATGTETVLDDESNTITVYTGTNGTLQIQLVNDASKITDSEEIKNIDTQPVTWNVVEASANLGYTLTSDGKIVVTTALTDENKELTVNLTATIKGNEKQAAGDASNKADEGTTETTYSFDKVFNFTLKLVFGNKPAEQA